MKRISKLYYKQIGDYLTDQVINSSNLENNRIIPNLYQFYFENLKSEFPDVDDEILQEIIGNFKYTKRNNWVTQQRLFKTFKNLYTRLKTILEIQKYLKTNDSASVTDIIIYLNSYMDYRKKDNKIEFKYKVYTSSTFIYNYKNITKENIQYYMDVLHLVFHNIVDFKKDDEDFKDVIIYYDKLMADLDIFIPSLLRKELISIFRKERSDKGVTKSQYKEILFAYFKSGWKNKDIEKETGIKYSTINKWKFIYNKETKESAELPSLDKVLKSKDEDLFKRFLMQPKYDSLQDIQSKILEAFRELSTSKLDTYEKIYYSLYNLLNMEA